MVQVARNDVLRGLKTFKRLAKQDLLASSLMSDPEFWEAQASTRRRIYDDLMTRVTEDGVDDTLAWGIQEYQRLSLVEGSGHPTIKGKEQALEMFFTIVGIEAASITRMRNGRPKMKEAAAGEFVATS